TGTIGGTVTLATNGATSFTLGPALNPATVGTVGTLTIAGVLTTNNFSKLNFDINSTSGSGDSISISTPASLPVLGATTQFGVNALGALTVGNTYTLISGYTGTIANVAANTSVAAITGADTGHVGYLVNNAGSLQLVIGNSTPATAYWATSTSGNWET